MELPPIKAGTVLSRGLGLRIQIVSLALFGLIFPNSLIVNIKLEHHNPNEWINNLPQWLERPGNQTPMILWRNDPL